MRYLQKSAHREEYRICEPALKGKKDTCLPEMPQPQQEEEQKQEAQQVVGCCVTVPLYYIGSQGTHLRSLFLTMIN